MKKILALLTLATALVFTSSLAVAQGADDDQSVAQGISVKATPSFNIYGRVQTMGFLQSLEDNFSDKNRLYLFLKQARFGVAGDYEDIKLDLQLAFGGEEEVKAPSPGVSLSLLDLSVDIPVYESIHFKVGQFKVPYGREGLTNSGYLQFSERSLQHLGFKVGRDVGMAVYGSSGDFTTTVGLFTGGGRNAPIRFIPQNLGFPMLVVRTGLNSGLDEDLFALKQTSLGSNQSGFAFFVNGLYTKDSKIGHSSVLNVKLADKSLLLNSNWNPFISKRPLDQGVFWQAGADVAWRSVLAGSTLLTGEAEVNYGTYSNSFGSIELTGGRAQVGILADPLDFAVRYSVLFPDEQFAYTDQGKSYQLVSDSPIHEVTLGATYFLRKDRLKIGIDFPMQFEVPVIMEPGFGAYVLTQQPDQTSYVAPPKTAPIQRQTVLEARVLIQFIF